MKSRSQKVRVPSFSKEPFRQLGVLLSDAWYKDLNGPPGCRLRWVRNQKSRESRAARPPLISTTVISCYQTHNDVTTYRTFFSVLILVNCIFLVNNFILWFNSSVCYYNYYLKMCYLYLYLHWSKVLPVNVVSISIWSTGKSYMGPN